MMTKSSHQHNSVSDAVETEIEIQLMYAHADLVNIANILKHIPNSQLLSSMINMSRIEAQLMIERETHQRLEHSKERISSGN